MAPGEKPDLLSNLPDCLLFLIISLLPFKESVRTSVLSQRWKNLCCQNTNLVFNESDFINLSIIDEETIETIKLKRFLFVRIMCRWISKFKGEVIDNFELYISEPMGFEAEITSLIEFAASKKVKSLVLDFSIPASRKISVIENLLTCLHYQKNGFDISRIFFNVLYVRKLTICSFLLQMIQDCDDPMDLHDSMKTQHLIMKTTLHPNDFKGIRIVLNSCPELESLTLDMVITRRIVRVASPIDPQRDWLSDITYECLKKTLKVVEVKNFRGGPNELYMLQYLVRTGRLMERLDLYGTRGMNDIQKRLVLVGAEKVQRKFERASRHLRITLHNA